MKELKTTCIMCPMGCPLVIEEADGVISVSGNVCKRGEVYGKQEFTSPKRVVTSLVRVGDKPAQTSNWDAAANGVVAVKTSSPVPKEKIFEVLESLKDIYAKPDVKIGDVLIKNVCGTGADIVATSRATKA